MEVSFIVLNYKSREYLETCIVSIFKKVINFEFEIIVVNNDEKKIKLENSYRNMENIRMLEINKNIGFAKANNRGAKISTGKYICFINPDASIVSDNIQDIINEFESDVSVGVIGPKILKEGEIQRWSVGADLSVAEILKGKAGLARSNKFWNSLKKIKVDWVSGVSMFIKREDFMKVGGFDENFFLYYEDVDLCKRIKKLNKKVIYFPSFEVNHLEGKSSNKKYEQKLQYFKAQDYYYKKWFGWGSCYLLKSIRFFYLLRYRILKVSDIFFSGKSKKYPKNNNS
ncbi:MAG: Glycosyl transferase, family 2 [Candidatus Moranbacteria bacterium GW2011_GWF2_34_56]|nr:MAG: Glycosyl transferase, family 2 [Candidatus Moranbacteria bacterium GW2011_GWF1_34_10]KKP64290.1 MAG: Glycosyl transferase, family 2 [Candidatus Moranbacteria bacterium GW2011_GWF2_34_56]HBI17370.1 hypothetical protein [Candidatus Moranbacteria bacterium]